MRKNVQTDDDVDVEVYIPTEDDKPMKRPVEKGEDFDDEGR